MTKLSDDKFCRLIQKRSGRKCYRPDVAYDDQLFCLKYKKGNGIQVFKASWKDMLAENFEQFYDRVIEPLNLKMEAAEAL